MVIKRMSIVLIGGSRSKGIYEYNAFRIKAKKKKEKKRKKVHALIK